MKALTDDDITKTAFNAAFERTCIAKYYNLILNPAAWQCSAVQSAMLSLPHSLDDVGTVLDIKEKKLKEGKAFLGIAVSMQGNETWCRTRNMPSDDPEKWEQFQKSVYVEWMQRNTKEACNSNTRGRTETVSY